MTRDPFHPVASGAAFLETASAGEALRRLESGIGAREPFLLLTGEAGTGKTALVNAALERWKDRVTAAFLPAPGLGGTELIEEIVLRFGAQPAAGASRPRLVACFEQVTADIIASQRVPWIVVDDAHRVAPEALEELRLLVNAALQAQRSVEVLLVGAPALEARLDEPALAAVRDRLSVRAHLGPLSVSETRRYVKHRIEAVGHEGAHVFPRKSCAELAAASGGIPRRINALASTALRLARDAGEPSVQVSHVRTAAELLGSGATPRARELEASRTEGDAVTSSAPRETPEAAVRSEPPAEGVEPTDAHARSLPGPTPSAARHGNALTDDYEAEAEAHRITTSHHDASEWVARFVGNQGPVRIGALAGVPPEWQEGSIDAIDARPRAAMRSLEPAPERRSDVAPHRIETSIEADDEASRDESSVRTRAQHRKQRRGTGRMVLVALSAVLIVEGVLVIRTGALQNLQLGRIGETSTAMTTPDIASVAIAAASVTPRVLGARRAAPAPAAPDTAGFIASPPDSEMAPMEPPPVIDTGSGRPAHRYSLEVGTYVDPQEAFIERDRIREATGMKAWVVVAPPGSAEMSRVLLGVYRTEQRAEAAAGMLMNRGTVIEASVVPLPLRGERQ